MKGASKDGGRDGERTAVMRTQPPPRPAGGGAAGGGSPGAAREHPLMEPMFWASAELLAFIPQLSRLGASLPPPDTLRAQIHTLLSEMASRAKEAGIPQEDVTEAQYALVALLDEEVVKSAWPGRFDWHARPLQLWYFQENTAGENFFVRLNHLHGKPHKAHVLQVYFLCLAMGFQGRYAISGGEGLGRLFGEVSAHLGQSVPHLEALSPRGEPPDRSRTILQREAPIVRLSLAIFALAVLVFVGLKLVLASSVASAVGPMDRMAGPERPPASGAPQH